MRVSIDGTKCSGHGLCYVVAGDLFEDDDNGFGRVRPEFSDTDVPAAMIVDAEFAAASCPEQAIELSD